MSKGTVLIIDDMSTHLLLLQTILDEEGYTTITYSNPVEAIKELYKGHINIMLLDIMMPGMDGFQVLDIIKEDNKISKIPIIVISAKTDSWSIKNALDKGAFDYITKPINIQDLRNKLKVALNS